MAFLLVVLFALALPSFSLAAAGACPPVTGLQLANLLSNSSTISTSRIVPRWSTYGQPTASLYVQVGREEDVATIVNYANQHGYQFLVQNGGNGWADTFDLEGCSVIIDLSRLSAVIFNADRTAATIQGGVTVSGMVAAAYAQKTRFANPTCNCLGFLGAALGAGLTRTAGLYGWSVDQLVSANVVLASGASVQVTPRSDPDLWWALRGAGPNFGIVTSARIRAYPQPGGDTAWQAFLTFGDDKITRVMQAIDDLDLTPHMQIDFLFSTAGAPSHRPLITVIPLYTGNASAGRAAFAPILRLGPSNVSESPALPYNQWNAFGDSFCTRGGRKPTYGASLARINATTFTAVYSEFKTLVASDPAAFVNASLLVENYPTAKAQAIGSQPGGATSFPFRDLPHHLAIIPWHNDPSLDARAITWGKKVRDTLWASAGSDGKNAYINFAHGDEPLESIYGASLPRLQRLKKVYDPENRFNQWFPLTPRS